jgi:cyclomaltodextrin glucanotransferase
MRDFRAHTLYFAFVDRFADGDPDNNGGKNPACFDAARSDPYRYWGGDLDGLTQRLDYLSNLGVSCLRLTPVFEQMSTLTLDRGRLGAPYHGYWTADFRRIEPHLIPRSEWDRPFSDRDTAFDRLVAACRERGIRLVLDVVCDRANPGGDDAGPGQMHDDGQWLLSTEHDTLGWFRKGLYRDEEGTGDSQIRFNEHSASFRGYLRGVLEDWADRGVDGYCFDAVHRMPIWFWQELTSTLRLKRADLSLCGAALARANWEEAIVDFANQAGLRLVDAAFQRRIVEGLCWKDVGGFRRIAQHLEHDDVFEDATSLVTCLDNEKTPRLLSLGLPPEHLVLALTLLMTSRGIPCIFYGTEQGLHDDTDGGGDPYNRPMMRSFDPDHPVARALSVLTALRRENLAVQRGHYKTLWLSDDVLVFRRVHGTDRVLVALNRGGSAKVDIAEVPLPNGPAIDLLEGAGAFVEGGRISGLVLPAGAARVFAHTEPREIVGACVLCRLSGYASRYGESVVITGSAPELGSWDIRRAVRLEYVNRNLWMGDVVFDVSCGKRTLYKYAVVDERGSVVRESAMPRVAEIPHRSGHEWADRWVRE